MGCSCGWRSHSPFDLTRILSFRANGGFIPISKVLILCHWRTDLISNKHCLPWNDWNKKQKDTHKCLLTLTEINNGHRVVLLLHGGIGKVHGGLLILMKVTMEMHQVLNERGDLLIAIFGKFFWTRLSWIQLLCYRWIVYSWWRSTVTDGACVNTTPRMNRFRDFKVCNNMATDEIDDHRSESDYKCTDDAALDAAPDPEDLPAVMSFSCLSKSLILWSCWCTCTLSCTTSVFRLVICPTNISICSWSPSSRGARSPLPQVSELTRACTTGRAEDVADLSACSRRSSVQFFFFFESAAPGIFYLQRSCAHSSSAPGVAVSGSRYRKGVNSGSFSVGEQDILWLVVPLPRPLSPRQ